MTTPTIDPLADDPVLNRRLEEEIVSLSSTSLGSPIMTPSSSPDRPADSAQHILSVEMLTTLLDRTEDVSRREGLLSERESFLKHQVTAITKREHDLDKREQALRFQKLPPLDKLRLALEQLEVTDLMKATQLYSAWQLKQLGQLPEPCDEILSSSIVTKQASDAEVLVQGAADDIFAPCRDCGSLGHICSQCPIECQHMRPVRTTTLDSTSIVAKASETDSTQPKLPDPKSRNEDMNKIHDTWLNESVGPCYAKGLVDRLERFEDKLQQLLSQAAGEEKNLSHESKNFNHVVALPKQTRDLAPKPSFDGRMHNKANFASSAFASPRSPGFGGSGGCSSGFYYGASLPQEGKPNPLNGGFWQPVNGEKLEYSEPSLLKKPIQVSTIDPSKQPGTAAFTRRVSCNMTKREPSWSESFANTSASTSKTATVPPPPKRNWPIPTKAPDLKAPTSFSNTFKVPEVNDEVSENELKDERKDGRISRFFRPGSPQVRSKDDEPNTFASRRPDQSDFEDPLSEAERHQEQQIKEWNAKDNERRKSEFTAEELRSFMYRD